MSQKTQPEVDCVVELSFDGEKLFYEPIPIGRAERVSVEGNGFIYVLADISKEPVRIAFETRQENLRLQGLAAWWFDDIPLRKSYLSSGPIAGTPFSVQLAKNTMLLTDDHQGKSGRFGYEFELELDGALYYVDPEIENRGDSGGGG